MALLTTIVIPVFNQCSFTSKCWEALRRHTPADESFEVIVVDNASTDETKSFLHQAQSTDAFVRVLTNDQNVGFARACNQGARAAAGEYLVFLNNDTEVREGWLQPLVSTLAQDPRVGAVGSLLLNGDGTVQSAGMYLVDCRKTGMPFMMWMYGSGMAPNQALGHKQARICPMVCGACLAMRRSLFRELDGFDEGFTNGHEDVDLCLRCGERGLLVVCQPASVVVHHGSPDPAERFRHHQLNRARLLTRWRDRITAHAVRTADGQIRFTSPDHPRLYAGPQEPSTP
jgi:GT2 family glycosyltransferase